MILLSVVGCGAGHPSTLPSGIQFTGLTSRGHGPAGGVVTQTTDEDALAGSQTSPGEPGAVRERILPIAPRLQWNTGHGYCGETSIQAIGLYYGAWISQQKVREAGGSEILLGVNIDVALHALGFAFSSWDPQSSQTPQFHAFALWMKQHLLTGAPVIFGQYLADGEGDDDYDHIVPASGIKLASAAEPDQYNAHDELVFANNFRRQNFTLAMGRLPTTRASCKKGLDQGGCIPQNTDFGVAIHGFVDQKRVTRPVSLTVDAWDEPNVAAGEAPRRMHATLIASALAKGQSYVLLRFDDARKVPVDGDAAEFLAADFVERIDFTAEGQSWTFHDPTAFGSNEMLYYRIVELP